MAHLLDFSTINCLFKPFLRHKREKKKILCEQNVLNKLCIFTRFILKSYSYGGGD